MKRRIDLKNMGIAALSALFAGISVHSENLWVFGIIGFAGIIYAWSRTSSAKAALWLGWLTGFIYFATSLRFLLAGYYSIGVTGILPVVGVVALYILICFSWGPAFYLARRLKHKTGFTGFVILWFLAEIIRAYFAPAIPPSFLGDVWSQTPVIQVVSIIRIEGLSLLTMIAAATIAKDIGKKPVPLLALGLFAALWKMGYEVEKTPMPRYNGPVIAAINTALPQDQRWNPEIIDAYIADLAERSQAAWASGADIVLWPENATPYFLESREFIAAAFPPEGKFLIHGATMIADPNIASAYNGFVVTGTGGETVATYRKVHLFPFAEYMPFAETVSRITSLGTISTPDIATGGYRRGTTLDQPLAFNIGEKAISIIPLICYEALVPITTPATDDTVIINMTNDAWWVGTSGAHYISSAGRVRAIERGVPMIRVANLGPSYMVDAKGRLIKPRADGFYNSP